jgi:hypothetical protein
MTFKRIIPPADANRERRSGMNRRWIKTPYPGAERRSGKDRRGEPPSMDAGDTAGSTDGRAESLEHLVISTTVRLEALARLLVAKGLLDPRELSDMLKTMQSEYRPPQIKDD